LKEKRLKKCPICEEKTKEVDHGSYVEITCFNCNTAAPIVVGYYNKKRKNDKRR
jgi:hypothetical protein